MDDDLSRLTGLNTPIWQHHLHIPAIVLGQEHQFGNSRVGQAEYCWRTVPILHRAEADRGVLPLDLLSRNARTNEGEKKDNWQNPHAA